MTQNPKFLKQLATGKIFPWTKILAGRKDMFPCDALPARKSALGGEAVFSGMTASSSPTPARQIADEEFGAIEWSRLSAEDIRAKAVEMYGVALDPKLKKRAMLEELRKVHDAQEPPDAIGEPEARDSGGGLL